MRPLPSWLRAIVLQALLGSSASLPKRTEMQSGSGMRITASMGQAKTSSYSISASYGDEGLGACGVVNKNTDLVVAVSPVVFDSYPYAINILFQCRSAR